MYTAGQVAVAQSNRALRAPVAAIFLALLVSLARSPARAQAPPPVGHWATSGASEELYVYQNGTCGFFFQGKLQVSGSCSWNPSSRGGILTISYPMPLRPGLVRYNIVWVNRTTITVWGDVFHRK
jgi:hypothetical protein